MKTLWKKLFFATLYGGLMWGFIMGSPALAVTVDFPDFSDTDILTLNGSTATVSTGDGVVLRLTPAEGSRSGSAFSSLPLNASTFSTFFKFRITEPGGRIFDCNTEAGADGIVFVIQSISSDIGGGGGGIGYQGIDTSVGVEFDTWCNAANNDPGSNHVGIDTDGSVNHTAGSPNTAEVTPNFDDGNVWYAWIDYDGSELSVFIGQSAARPPAPVLTRSLDIPVLLGQDEAYVGFTSGTGVDWGNHDIILWEYRDSFDPIPGPTECTEADLEAAFEEGRRSCIEDPASCGITAGPTVDGNCATFNLFTNTLHVPCLSLGSETWWLDMELAGGEPLVFELMDYGPNLPEDTTD